MKSNKQFSISSHKGSISAFWQMLLDFYAFFLSFCRSWCRQRLLKAILQRIIMLSTQILWRWLICDVFVCNRGRLPDSSNVKSELIHLRSTWSVVKMVHEVDIGVLLSFFLIKEFPSMFLSACTVQLWISHCNWYILFSVLWNDQNVSLNLESNWAVLVCTESLFSVYIIAWQEIILCPFA
jgi:hypothetical protein